MPRETKIQVRQGTDAQWTAASSAVITNAVVASGQITYTIAERTPLPAFTAGEIISTVGVLPSQLNVTGAEIVSANSTTIVVESDATGTFVSGGIAYVAVLQSGELGYVTDEDLLVVGDGVTQWADLKKSAVTNASQTFIGTQAIEPEKGREVALELYAKPDRERDLYRGVSATNSEVTYYSAVPLKDISVGEKVAIAGFVSDDLNLGTESSPLTHVVDTIAEDLLSFTVASGTGNAVDETRSATATFVDSDTPYLEAYDNTGAKTISMSRTGAINDSGVQVNRTYTLTKGEFDGATQVATYTSATAMSDIKVGDKFTTYLFSVSGKAALNVQHQEIATVSVDKKSFTANIPSISANLSSTEEAYVSVYATEDAYVAREDGWLIINIGFRKVNGVTYGNMSLQREGADIIAGTTGDIANIKFATLPSGYFSTTLTNGIITSSAATEGGGLVSGYVNTAGELWLTNISKDISRDDELSLLFHVFCD